MNFVPSCAPHPILLYALVNADVDKGSQPH